MANKLMNKITKYAVYTGIGVGMLFGAYKIGQQDGVEQTKELAITKFENIIKGYSSVVTGYRKEQDALANRKKDLLYWENAIPYYSKKDAQELRDIDVKTQTLNKMINDVITVRQNAHIYDLNDLSL